MDCFNFLRRLIISKTIRCKVYEWVVGTVIAGILVGYAVPSFIAIQGELADINGRRIEAKQAILKEFAKSLSINLSLLAKLHEIKTIFCESKMSESDFKEYTTAKEKYWSTLSQQDSLYNEIDILSLYFTSDDFTKQLPDYKKNIKSVEDLLKTECGDVASRTKIISDLRNQEDNLVLSMAKEIQSDEDRREKKLHTEENDMKGLFLKVGLVMVVLLSAVCLSACSERFGKSHSIPSHDPRPISSKGDYHK